MVLVVVCGLLMAANASAEKQYISGVTSITLRNEPGNERKILEMIPTGSVVEVVEPGEEWSLVISERGNQGYVLSRFLSSDTPPSVALIKLQEKYDQMISQMADPAQEIERLREQNEQLISDLDGARTSLQTLKADYEKLKSESKDYLAIQSKFDMAQEELSAATTRNKQLTEEVSAIKTHQRLRWFLTGAGVLLLGVIIGVVAKRPRRRSLRL
jgi:SH3 domain protein